jgi:hypothetical protein
MDARSSTGRGQVFRARRRRGRSTATWNSRPVARMTGRTRRRIAHAGRMAGRFRRWRTRAARLKARMWVR